jgi:hypothetical protein
MEKIRKDKESKTEKRNQRELLWFQTGGALNFITTAPHCGELVGIKCFNTHAHIHNSTILIIKSEISEQQNKQMFLKIVLTGGLRILNLFCLET